MPSRVVVYEAVLSAEQTRRIVEALRSGPALRLAIVFGSVATGRTRSDSDLDIGIVPRETSLSLHEELALQAELSRAAGREVDLVRLDRAAPLVRWEAAKVAHLLLEGGRGELSRFVAEAGIEHGDVQPLLDEATVAYARRAAGQR